MQIRLTSPNPPKYRGGNSPSFFYGEVMNIIQKQIQKWTTYKPKNYNSYWHHTVTRLSDHIGVLMFGAAILALVIGFVTHG